MDPGNSGDNPSLETNTTGSHPQQIDLRYSEGDQLIYDRNLDLLNSFQRRQIIRIVANEETIEFNNLVDEIAARQNDEAQGTDTQRKRAYVSLKQTHLSKLENEGIVEWDRDAGMVSIGSEAGPIAWIIKRIDEVIGSECSGNKPGIPDIEPTPRKEETVDNQDGSPSEETGSESNPIDKSQVWKEGYKEGFVDGFAEGKHE